MVTHRGPVDWIAGGYHVHALWCDCLNKSRRDVWQSWFKRYGRARIEPINNQDDVADYCAKYVAKERSWWNVKLLGTRHPAFANFKLSNDTHVGPPIRSRRGALLSPLVLQEGFDLIMRPAKVEDEGWSLALENKPQIQPAATFHERPDAP